MYPEEVFRRIGKLQYMKLEQARIFYEFIVSNQLRNCLELGFFHGTSSAYIAGAVEDIGGRLTTIDLVTALDRKPNIEEVLAVTELRKLVNIYLEPKSFNWRLMKFLQEGQYETYDFCYIDGGHTWYDTGLAFCLVERLLKPGGWVVFDDLHFTFEQSGNSEKGWVKRMPSEEQTEPQVERVFELLVESNPYFGSFRRLGRFGFAQKRAAVWSEAQRAANKIESIVSRGLERSYHDRDFRAAFLAAPARVLARISSLPESAFSHIRVIESDSAAPCESETSEYGSTLVYMEKPSWDKGERAKALSNMTSAEAISHTFTKCHRKPPNLMLPRTLSEKIQYRKLYDRDPDLPRLADKVLVKEYVAHLIGEEWMIPSLWSGTTLPPREGRNWPLPYVLKANHGCGWNLFIRSAEDQDWGKIEGTAQNWLRQKYGVDSAEWLYGLIDPQLLVEPLVGDSVGEFPVEYKIMVFDGHALFIDRVTGRGNAYSSAIYDRDWKYQGARWGKHSSPFAAPVPSPPSLDKMIWAAELLASKLSFVRVDFYEVCQRPLFSEMTFYPGSGYSPFEPESFDEKLGQLWRYPEEYGDLHPGLANRDNNSSP